MPNICAPVFTIIFNNRFAKSDEYFLAGSEFENNEYTWMLIFSLFLHHYGPVKISEYIICDIKRPTISNSAINDWLMSSYFNLFYFQ